MRSKRPVLVVGALLAFLAAGCARPPEDWEPLTLSHRAIPLPDLAHSLRLHADRTPQYWRLTGTDFEVRIFPGLSMAWVNGEYVPLDEAVAEANGVPLVPPVLAERIRGHMAARAPETAARPWAGGATVVLDAGHGGKDMGGVGTRGTQEAGVVLDITRQVARALREAGANVILTRDTDDFVELRERAEIANRSGAALFVSIHANVKHPTSPPVSGVEIYYPTNAFRIEAAKGNPRAPPVAEILKSTQLSLKLARCVHNSILDHTWAKSNGIRQHPKALAVLRLTHCPAILVEVGYLSDVQEEARLRDPEYRRLMAHGISDGILGYLQVNGGAYASR